VIDSEALLVLSHLNIQNANAISSPMLWGFPSPTAFLGFVHALHRVVQPELGLGLDGVGIVCHRFEPQASQPAGKRTRVFHLTRNSYGSDGKPPALIEEGRVHLDVTLVIGVKGAARYEGTPIAELEARIAEIVSSMRIAGGSLLPRSETKCAATAALHLWPGTEEGEALLLRRLRRKLLPGFALVSREGLLEQRHRELVTADPNASMLDAFLDLASLNIDPPNEGGPDGKEDWRVRRRSGWLVPISTGFQAISELYPPGAVKNARDRGMPFRFVEGVYTLGEWKSPHRIKDLRHILWAYTSESSEGLYRCTTKQFSQ